MGFATQEVRELIEKSPRAHLFQMYENTVDKINQSYGRRIMLKRVSARTFGNPKTIRLRERAIKETLKDYLKRNAMCEIESGRLGFDNQGLREWVQLLEVIPTQNAMPFIQEWLKRHKSSSIGSLQCYTRKEETRSMIEAYYWNSGSVSRSHSYLFVRGLTDREFKKRQPFHDLGRRVETLF